MTPRQDTHHAYLAWGISVVRNGWLWRYLFERLLACRDAELGQDGRDHQECRDDQEGRERAQTSQQRHDEHQANATADVPNAVRDRISRRARPRGEVLSRPRIGHGHPDVEAEE